MRDQEELYRKALIGAAQLVSQFGDEFLPAFIRMEEELEILAGKSLAEARAVEIAKKINQAAYSAINSNASRRPTNAPPSP